MRRQGKIKTIAMILLSVVILLYFIHDIGLKNLTQNFSQVDILFLFWPLFLVPIIIFLKIGRWFYLVRLEVSNTRFFDAIKSFLGGTLVAIFTPGKLGAVTRVFYFEDKKAELTALVIFEKITDLFSFLVMSVVMAYKLGIMWGLVFSVVSFIMLLLLLRIDLFYKLIWGRIPLLVKEKIRVLNSFEYLKKLKRISLQLILMAFFITLVTIFQFYLIINAFGSASFKVVCLAFPFSIFLANIPISFGGIGVREGSMIYLFAMFNVPVEFAMNASLFFYLSNVLPFLCGTLFLPKLWRGLCTSLDSKKNKILDC